jgi:hypothetical protein
MNNFLKTKTAKTTLLLTSIALGVACGYSSKGAPPVAGNVPAIAQLSPESAAAGGTAFTLTVIGSKFATNAVVNWNGVPQGTTYMNNGQLTAAIPASLIMNSATIAITVTNPATPGTGPYGGGGTLAETSTPANFAVN